MKTFKKAILALSITAISLSYQRDLQQEGTPFLPNISYKKSLNCGLCVMGGYTYCIEKKLENLNSTINPVAIQKCMNDPFLKDDIANQVDWNCTSSYTDRVYAKFVCQYDYTMCGENNLFVIGDYESKKTIYVEGLKQGYSCFYRFKTTCGAPTFQVSTTNKAAFEVEYVEFLTEQAVDNSNFIYPGDLASISEFKRASPPRGDFPDRRAVFYGAIGSSSVYLSNMTNETDYDPVGISGRYDKEIGGKKVFFNPTQGESPDANKTAWYQKACESREQYLFVTALQDNAYTHINLTSTSYPGYSNAFQLTVSGCYIILILQLLFL